jgi:outer membrane protein OmpA-like peptidoglycan-associated protein
VAQKIVLRGVHFDFNKAIIRPGDAAVLDEAITTLKANPNVVIDVNGYCDAIGSMEYNLKLSERRGNAVANYLLNGGIQATQLRVHGFGKTDFVATNRTAEGRAENRRVELVPEQ